MKKGQKNPDNKKQNKSPISVPTQSTDPTNEKSEITMEGLDIGNKKLQLQRERQAREEEEYRRTLEEKAKEIKNNASKKKSNKKSTSRAPKPEPKAEKPIAEIVQKLETQTNRNASGNWNITDKSEADNSYQESAPRRNSLKSNQNISNDPYFDNEYENTNTKTSWGKRENSYQNPETWDNTENENFNSELNDSQNISQKYSRPDDYKNAPSYRDNYKYSNRNFGSSKRDYNQQNYGYSPRNEGKEDRDFQYFFGLSKRQPEINHSKLNEIKGDLFTAPKDFSLAHCVAEDMSMGAGIAKNFRKEFGEVGKLLSQNQRTGGLAVLEKETRYIYYLVTKYQSRGKPSYYTLWQSLHKLKEHIQENNVKKLALPQIGCGLDRLEWHIVRQMLEHIFKDVDIKIDYYVYDESLSWNKQIKTLEVELICENDEKSVSEIPKKTFNFGINIFIIVFGILLQIGEAS